MSSIENLTLSSDAKIHDEEVNSFNMSLLIGLLIITITVLVIVSIIMNVWMKSKRSKVMPYISEKKLSTVPIKVDKPISFQLTPPKLIFNKDTTLPVYRKTDTWDQYLKMIQSPNKLNDVIRTMKISESPSKKISFNIPENDNKSGNRKISYDNNINNHNHTLQRESLHLQYKIYNRDDYYFI